jgi:hypothetical protein
VRLLDNVLMHAEGFGTMGAYICESAGIVVPLHPIYRKPPRPHSRAEDEDSNAMERQCRAGEGLGTFLCCWGGDGWDQVRIKWCCSHLFAFQHISWSRGCFLYPAKLDREEGDTSVYQASECLPMGQVGPMIDSHLDHPQCVSSGEGCRLYSCL